MLAMSGLSAMKAARKLIKGEKKVSILLKPTGAEYEFEGDLFTGKDVRNAMKFLIRAYKVDQHEKAKINYLKKEKEDGEERQN